MMGNMGKGSNLALFAMLTLSMGAMYCTMPCTILKKMSSLWFDIYLLPYGVFT